MMLTRWIATGTAATALTVTSAADVLAQGCAMCQTALDGPVDPLTEAFNVSSLFLMTTPYIVVSTIAVWLYLAARRQARLLDEAHPTGHESE